MVYLSQVARVQISKFEAHWGTANRIHIDFLLKVWYTVTHCFVQVIKVASEISTSIWQKKNLNRFEQFWVEIYLKNLVRKI